MHLNHDCTLSSRSAMRSLPGLFLGFILVFCPAFSSAIAAQPLNPAAPQAPAAPAATATFDVAAIHQNLIDQSGRSHIYSSPGDGQFRTVNLSLRALMQWAFEMPETRILGGPSWVESTKWDIEAKADSSVDA